MDSIYLAGPLGFFEAGRYYQSNVLIPALAQHFSVLNPWDIFEELKEEETLNESNFRIGKRNAEMITASRYVLAVLDGADVDSGTSAEIGFAAAIGRTIVGLRTDFRQSGDNDAAVVNLQVQYFIRYSGGDIAETLTEAIAMLAMRSTL